MHFQSSLPCESNAGFLTSDLESLKTNKYQIIPMNLLTHMIPSGIPEYRFCLNVGSIIVLLRNLDQSDACNGTRLTVKLLYENIIVAETVSVNKKTILIPQIKLAPFDVNLSFVLQR